MDQFLQRPSRIHDILQNYHILSFHLVRQVQKGFHDSGRGEAPVGTELDKRHLTGIGVVLQEIRNEHK